MGSKFFYFLCPEFTTHFFVIKKFYIHGGQVGDVVNKAVIFDGNKSLKIAGFRARIYILPPRHKEEKILFSM
jgi:hypothetical protein